MRASRVTSWLAGGLMALSSAARAGSPFMASKSRQLADIQKQLDAARREAEQYKQQEQALGEDLQEIHSRTGESRRRFEALQRHVADAEHRQRQLKTKLLTLGQASTFWRDALASDVRRYAAERRSRDEYFGSEDLRSEGFMRAAAFEKVDMLLSLQGVSRQTALAEAQTRRSAQELAQRSRQAKRERESTEKEYQAKKAAVAQAQQKAAAASARAKDLEETARALTRLLHALRAPKRSSVAQTHWDVPANSLLWPAQGSVIKPFGRQRNPELDTWVISQGILLKTAAGAAVEAVRAGRVIFSGPFRSYGQVLILDHGSNLFSIYGDLGQILTEKGAQVKPGEVIAKAGAGAPDSAGRLYFELRRGTEALDPLAWLKKP